MSDNNDDVDYEYLLKKYIEHVGDSEGVDFIPKKGADIFHSTFSPREIVALHRLAGWNSELGEYE